MEHDIFFDGNVKEYSWSIKTNDKVADQIREHPPAFRSGGKLDIKNNEESRFVALHVGIYWGLGVNIIKDNEYIGALDYETMMQPGKYAFVSEKKIYECVGKKLLQGLEDQQYIDIIIKKVGRLSREQDNEQH